MKIPENRYLGSLCKNKHDYEESGQSLRNASHACIVCQKERGRRFYIANKERVNRANRLWAKNNPEKRKMVAKKYRDANKEKYQKYRDANKEKYSGYSRVYREKNKEKIKSSQHEWYLLNKEKVIKRAKACYLANKPDRHCACGIKVSAKKKFCPRCAVIAHKIARKRSKVRSLPRDALYAKEQRSELSDTYIRALIGLPKTEIPQEVIDAKRLFIKIYRLIKTKEVKSGKD